MHVKIHILDSLPEGAHMPCYIPCYGIPSHLPKWFYPIVFFLSTETNVSYPNIRTTITPDTFKHAMISIRMLLKIQKWSFRES